MTKVIKLSRVEVWFNIAFLAFRSLAIPFSVLFARHLDLEQPLDPFDRLTFFLALLFFAYGALGILHLFKFSFGKRRRTELHFDGTDISVRIAGIEQARFSECDVRAYFPYRNEIEMTDGRRIALPSSAPHLGSNEIEMARPWVNAWWPELKFPAAIEEAERKLGWIRHLPKASKALGTFGFLLGLILDDRYGLVSSTAMLAVAISFSFVFPDPLEHHWRRKVVIHFPAFNNAELEPVSCVEHVEPFAHDRP